MEIDEIKKSIKIIWIAVIISSNDLICLKKQSKKRFSKNKRMIKKSFILNEIPAFLLLPPSDCCLLLFKSLSTMSIYPGNRFLELFFAWLLLLNKKINILRRKKKDLTVKVLRVGMISCKINVHSYALSWHPFRTVHKKKSKKKCLSKAFPQKMSAILSALLCVF